MRGVRNIFLLALPWLFACGQKLDLFLNEDKEIVLTIESETTMSPTISIVEGKFHFNVTFHLDRKGNYYFYHGGSCNVDNNFLITSGTLIKDTAVSVKVGITFSNITAHGKTVTLCVEDTAAYKKKSHSFDFSGVLTSIAQFINEGIGSYSLSNSSSTTTEFVLFQNDWTGVNPHRSTGSVVQNGVQLPRYHTAFIDPNDGYRLKYAVVDTANHRVLLFNKPPTAGFDSANVVVGQTSFIAGNTNAGGVVSCSGFDTPTHVSVSASGVLFVTDASNNRVLGFGQAPTTNGASANFVLGQSACNIKTSGITATTLNNPLATRPMQGKLYIADSSNNRVVVYNGIPTTTNAAADFAIGQANLTTNTTTDADFTIQSDYLKAPTDVLLHNNHLYISDTGYHRVLVFNTVPTIVDQKPNLIIGHSAANNILPNRGLPVAAEGLNYPTNLTAVGNTLAVADRDNHRALLYNLPITANAEAAQKVLGQSTMNANMPGVGQGQFNQPNGIFFDGGFMWVVDSLDHRVQVVAIP